MPHDRGEHRKPQGDVTCLHVESQYSPPTVQEVAVDKEDGPVQEGGAYLLCLFGCFSLGSVNFMNENYTKYVSEQSSSTKIKKGIKFT